MRVGRFPSMRDGGASWSGVIYDTNAPEEDHWWPIMSGEVPVPDHIHHEQAKMLVKPDNWNFYIQPAGMVEKLTKEGGIDSYEDNDNAENINNLLSTYYSNLIRGKTKVGLMFSLMNRLGQVEGSQYIRV